MEINERLDNLKLYAAELIERLKYKEVKSNDGNRTPQR